MARYTVKAVPGEKAEESSPKERVREALKKSVEREESKPRGKKASTRGFYRRKGK